MANQESLKNAAIGAVVTFILFFVPVLGPFSPVLGGGTSGYLEDKGGTAGAVAGIYMAVLSGIPALILGLSGMALGSIPLLGDSIIAGFIGGIGALGGLFVIALWVVWTIYAVMLGVVGGIIGGLIAE